MKLKQQKSTWDFIPDFTWPEIFTVSIETQLHGYFYGKDKNPAIWLALLELATKVFTTKT